MFRLTLSRLRFHTLCITASSYRLAVVRSRPRNGTKHHHGSIGTRTHNTLQFSCYWWFQRVYLSIFKGKIHLLLEETCRHKWWTLTTRNNILRCYREVSDCLSELANYVTLQLISSDFLLIFFVSQSSIVDFNKLSAITVTKTFQVKQPQKQQCRCLSEIWKNITYGSFYGSRQVNKHHRDIWAR